MRAIFKLKHLENLVIPGEIHLNYYFKLNDFFDGLKSMPQLRQFTVSISSLQQDGVLAKMIESLPHVNINIVDE